MAMVWVFLILSGLMEIGCIVSLKYANGFTNITAIIFYTIFGFTSAYLLSLTLKSLPLGVSFLIWIGVAAVGIVLLEHFMYNKTYDPTKLIFMTLIIIGIVGLKYLEN